MRRYLLCLMLIPYLACAYPGEARRAPKMEERKLERPKKFVWITKGEESFQEPCPPPPAQTSCPPCPPPCYGTFFSFAELLIWQAKEQALDYAVSASAPSSTLQPPLAPDTFPSTLDDRSHYRPGFRVGIGYERDWDGSIYWTQFYSKANNSIAATASNGPVIPVLLNNSSFPDLLVVNGASADGTWKLNFNVVDFEMGYVLSCACFRFRPHLGVRGAWIDQRINVNYNRVTFGVTPLALPANYVSLNKNNFSGVGLRIGGDGAWNFCRCLSLFGQSGISLLSGTIDVIRREILTTAATYGSVLYPAGTERARTQVTRHQLMPALDLMGGIGWHIACGCLGVHLSCAWECQLWFAQNQMLNVIDITENFRYFNQRGNLTLQGLTAQAAITF
ncbi:MAG: hypothetical protein JSR80_06355 [Verrucomicrobia bacterium]|nr:hypothetical protein [Verrucomicrobiota bacterium]